LATNVPDDGRDVTDVSGSGSERAHPFHEVTGQLRQLGDRLHRVGRTPNAELCAGLDFRRDLARLARRGMGRGSRLVELRGRLTNLAGSIHAAAHTAGYAGERRRNAAGAVGNRRANSCHIG
jgi:hypothetical protein